MTDNRDAHTEIKRALLPVLMDEYGGTEEDWTAMRSLTHVAVALLPVVARIKADAAAETVAAIEAVHGRYFDLDQTPSIMTDTTPEPEDVWRYDRDLRAALSAGRTALNTRLAQAEREAAERAWDQLAERVEVTAVKLRHLIDWQSENPYRAEASGEGQ